MTAATVVLLILVAFTTPWAAFELHFKRRDRIEAPAQREWDAIRAAWRDEDEANS